MDLMAINQVIKPVTKQSLDQEASQRRRKGKDPVLENVLDLVLENDLNVLDREDEVEAEKGRGDRDRGIENVRDQEITRKRARKSGGAEIGTRRKK